MRSFTSDWGEETRREILRCAQDDTFSILRCAQDDMRGGAPDPHAESACGAPTGLCAHLRVTGAKKPAERSFAALRMTPSRPFALLRMTCGVGLQTHTQNRRVGHPQGYALILRVTGAKKPAERFFGAVRITKWRGVRGGCVRSV